MKKLKKIYKKIRKYIFYAILFILFRIVCLFTKLKKNRVLFLSDVREKLGGNLQMMDEALSNKDYEKIYCLKKSRQTNEGIKGKWKKIYNICTSEVILLDDFCSYVSFMKVRKGQQVVQLWHGPGAYKTFGLSRGDKTPSLLKRMLTHRNYTKAIVTAPDIRGCYSEGFGMDIENVKATGFPRTDIFFDKKYIKEVQDKLYDEYKEFKKKKVIMFAPTYRGVSLPKSYYDYNELDVDKLYKELHKDYIFIIKWHPGLKDSEERQEFNQKIEKYKDFFYDFTSYRDVNDLLLVSDILITDYSSVIFDYLLVDRPIVYFTYDLDTYDTTRGFYFPFEDYVYGNVAKNTKDLIKYIKKSDMCEDKRKAFNEKFMISCDGKATEKTVKEIFK